MAGKIFTLHEKFNPYPGKYSFDNWNRAVDSNESYHMKIIGQLTKGNFYQFMNVLLDFEYVKEAGMYGPKKERRFGARRS